MRIEKVSVTDLDFFRMWRKDEDADVPMLLRRLRREDPPSLPMRIGTAFHSILEGAQAGNAIHSVVSHGIEFRFDLDEDIALPEFREVPISRTYTVDGEPIIVRGRVDGWHGLRVDDHKTTGRLDVERLEASYQWRMYLDMTGATSFRWNVFEVIQYAGDAHVTVRGLSVLNQSAYPGLARDCHDLVTDFARFMRDIPEPSELEAAEH